MPCGTLGNDLYRGSNGKNNSNIIEDKTGAKNKQDLIQEITELYKKFPAVKEYYQVQEGDIEVITMGSDSIEL